MRLALSLAIVLVGCGVDTTPRMMGGGGGSDPGVDAGTGGGGGSSAPVDARMAPPDGIPQGLAPCDEAGYHSDFSWVQRSVFDVSCAVSGCHNTVERKASLDLSTGHAYASLVNVASTQHTGWMRVVPGSSPESMLMVQIGGEPGPALEGYMPWGMPRLCNAQVDAIRRWVSAGAAND
jgi:hypothetical protein